MPLAILLDNKLDTVTVNGSPVVDYDYDAGALACSDFNTVKPQERLEWRKAAEYRMEVTESASSEARKVEQN